MQKKARLLQNTQPAVESKTELYQPMMRPFISSDFASPFLTAIPAVACHGLIILPLARLATIEFPTTIFPVHVPTITHWLHTYIKIMNAWLPVPTRKELFSFSGTPAAVSPGGHTEVPTKILEEMYH